MPVIPEDIWMNILQISEEDAFLKERAQTAKASRSDRGPNNPTPSAVTRLKPISAKFSAACVQWRRAVLASSACWVTTVNCPMETPLLETVLRSSLQSHLASDIDIYIDEGDINSEEVSSVSLKLSGLVGILLEHLRRWRSLMLINMEHQDIPPILKGLINPAVLPTRLISLDVICTPGLKPTRRDEQLAFINWKLPALRRLHIDSDCLSISVGSAASFPDVASVSMPTYCFNMESLLSAISETNHLESLTLRCYDKWLDLESKLQVLVPRITSRASFPLVGGAQFSLPFLTKLRIEMRIHNVLPLLHLIELSELRTLSISTGDLDDNPDMLLPMGGKPVNLPSLLYFRICGMASIEKHLSMVSHLLMPSLTRLCILSRNGEINGDMRERNLPIVRLPSLNTMTLRPAPTCSDFGIFFEAPNLETLQLSAGPLGFTKPEYECVLGPTTASFPMLKTVEMDNYTPFGIDAFLSHHDLPSLVIVRLPSMNRFNTLSVWEKLFERQRMVMAKLEKFDLCPIPEGLLELLSRYAPLTSPHNFSGKPIKRIIRSC